MKPTFQYSNFEIWVGDCLKSLKELPDNHIHCAVTSPPYFNLRDYQTGQWEGGDPACDHKLPVSAKSVASSTLHGAKNNINNAFSGFISVCGKCGATRVDEQVGLEATPEAYVDRLVGIFRELRRVLRDDGVLWLNLGDSSITIALVFMMTTALTPSAGKEPWSAAYPRKPTSEPNALRG